jgi:hypothetical protein
LLETTEADWDIQHDVMAKGSFLVAQAAARVLIEQGFGGDIVYISSKNSVFAGPNNVAYGAAKADQAHQVSGWGAQRAAVYGVAEEDLGAYYAGRTLLKREVLPEHIAAAVLVLTAGELEHTTGLHIPVDSGVPAAFLR